MIKKVFCFVIVICVTSSAVQAQGKIGYVSADEIFALMPEVAKADKDIATYQEQLTINYQDEQKQMDEAYAKFIKDSATLTPAVKEFRRKDLQNKITELQGKEQQLNELLATEKDRQLKPIREKLIKAIQDVAKENSFQHVLYKEQAIVFPEANDITPLVKKKLGIK